MIPNEFPVEVLTPEISDFISNLSDERKINKNVVASSVLNACGFVLSDSYELIVKNGWNEKSNLWTVIALPSGMGKSVITRHIFSPIMKYQSKLISDAKKHNALATEWKEMIKAAIKNKKLKHGENPIEVLPEYRNWLLTNGLNETPPEFVKHVNLFSDDFTFERFATMLEDNNGHAFMIRGDEIAGLFKMFNKYRGGNDEETLLKLWGYDAIKVDRVNEDSAVFIETPIVSLFGATQKELLFDIYTDTRKNNGNVFRFLFCVDADDFKVKNVFDYDNEFNNDSLEKFLNHHLSYFVGCKTCSILMPENGVINYMKEWRDGCKTKFVDEDGVDVKLFSSIMGKMDSYVFRIAIIINRLRAYFNNTLNETIVSVDDIKGSTKIVEFYIQEIINVLSLTDVTYRKYLKNKQEIFFYETQLQQSSPYFEVIQLIERRLGYTTIKANNTLNKWQECGIVRRNSKGMIYKVITKK